MKISDPGRDFVRVRSHQIPEGSFPERGLAHQQLEQNTSKCVDVRTRVHAATPALFGGRVPEHGGGQLLARRHLEDTRHEIVTQTEFQESDRDRQSGLAGRDQKHVFGS